MADELPALQVLAAVDSSSMGDPDDVPFYEGEAGYCQHWGAFADSPVPHHRVFIVFNRKPVDDAEAVQVACEHFGTEEERAEAMAEEANEAAE